MINKESKCFICGDDIEKAGALTFYPDNPMEHNSAGTTLCFKNECFKEGMKKMNYKEVSLDEISFHSTMNSLIDIKACPLNCACIECFPIGIRCDERNTNGSK